MFVIQNELLSVSVNAKGAELNSIYHRQHELEYLWSGDAAFWAKKSPILFPIVGTLKQNTYFYQGQAYELGRHGFARENDFTVSHQSGNSLGLSLKSNEKTWRQFPFMFHLMITYTVEQHFLHVTYQVVNEGEGVMYFSIGGHPAFNVPLVSGTAYEDYFLEFGTKENAGRWPITAEGLLESAPVPLLHNTNQLFLTKDLFKNDALVLKHPASDRVALKSAKTSHGLTFYYPGFPYLGIWAARNADFVCIEPWCGIADSVNSNQQLSEKEGIEHLAPQQQFERTWKLELF
jgi:galactose mutarotase-like enzyme